MMMMEERPRAVMETPSSRLPSSPPEVTAVPPLTVTIRLCVRTIYLCLYVVMPGCMSARVLACVAVEVFLASCCGEERDQPLLL